MDTFTHCHVCRADNTKVCSIDLNFYQFPSGLTALPDQVWRSNFLRALKFPEELIAQPPSLIEKKRIICSRHFVDSCFELKDDGILHLIQGSVPELFLEELQINEQQVEVTISDDEDDDVPPQPNHYLDDESDEDDSMMSIPEWTFNLDRQD